MTFERARQLLELSRQLNWSFPSSVGSPVRWETQVEWVDRMVKERNSFIKAAKLLMCDVQGEMAMEIAANVWRLWVEAWN